MQPGLQERCEPTYRNFPIFVNTCVYQGVNESYLGSPWQLDAEKKWYLRRCGQLFCLSAITSFIGFIHTSNQELFFQAYKMVLEGWRNGVNVVTFCYDHPMVRMEFKIQERMFQVSERFGGHQFVLSFQMNKNPKKAGQDLGIKSCPFIGKNNIHATKLTHVSWGNPYFT